MPSSPKTDIKSALEAVTTGPLTWRASNLAVIEQSPLPDDQNQTSGAFTEKWALADFADKDFEAYNAFQQEWYLKLYGFSDLDSFSGYLRQKSMIVDCGAGKGTKAAWFASLSPETYVVAVELSDAIFPAAEYYRDKLPNLAFVKADIVDMPFFGDGCFDFVNCDQVIHHTHDPEATFKELVRIVRSGADVTCYVYRKKALPRELLDDYFREASKNMSDAELKALSEQLTDLGKMLSDLKVELDFPDIPALGIRGGRQDLQRFIYWNFLKCFWNAELGRGMSTMTNYDWYAPSQAARYSEAEFRRWIEGNDLEIVHFHKEEACYSGRFRKPT